MSRFHRGIVAVNCVGLVIVLVLLPIRVNINVFLYVCAGILLAAALLIAVVRR